MRKCVKVILFDFNTHFKDIDTLYQTIKKRIPFEGLEGVVQPEEEEVHMVIYGLKERVDDAVDALEEFVITEGAQTQHMMGLSVEPFLKDEDYRGVFRFIQRA